MKILDALNIHKILNYAQRGAARRRTAELETQFLVFLKGLEGSYHNAPLTARSAARSAALIAADRALCETALKRHSTLLLHFSLVERVKVKSSGALI